MAMPEPRLEQMARFGGIVFVVLAIGGFLVAGDAGLDDGVKIASYFADHRGRILIGFHIAAIGLLAFVLWSWWIMDALWRVGGTRNSLGVAVFVAGAMTATVEFGVIALAMTLAVISTRPVDPSLARMLANAYQAFSYVDFFPLALFFLMLGIVVLRTRIVGAWVGWVSIVLVPVCLITAFPTLGLDLSLGLLTFVGIIVANVALIRSKVLTRGSDATV
jgi:hypothetical protein